jgi:ribonuclease BN (tRNA processing enzyme)
LINDCLAIDAGCLGLIAPVSEQQAIKHVLLSHSHIDHIASLPLFLENVFQSNHSCPEIFASQDVWQSLLSDMFNERVWPDLSLLNDSDHHFYEQRTLKSESPLDLNGLIITPIAVDHTVPTLGFLIEDQHSAIVISSDTGPTQRIWEVAGASKFRDKLKAVFLECSFPNDYDWLARESKHLCTEMFVAEIAKLPDGPPFLTVAVHVKAAMQDRTRRELESCNVPNLIVGGRDQTWEF